MPEKVVEKKELQKLPGFSQGVRVNSSLRMLKMAAPICPNSKIEMERDRDGRLVPKEQGPDRMNCQLGGGEWWAVADGVAPQRKPVVSPGPVAR